VTKEISQQLKEACFRVGHFLYHFALLEEQINRAMGKLFDFDNISSKILCTNIDFLKKLHIVQTCIIEQFSDKNGRQIDRKRDKGYTSVFNDIRAINDERTKVVHSPFDPSDKGILFQRVTARDGVLKQSHEENEWDEKTFESMVQQIIDTTKRLEEYVDGLQPYEPKLDFSDTRNSGYIAAIL
jgi:hypothetical protein